MALDTNEIYTFLSNFGNSAPPQVYQSPYAPTLSVSSDPRGSEPRVSYSIRTESQTPSLATSATRLTARMFDTYDGFSMDSHSSAPPRWGPDAGRRPPVPFFPVGMYVAEPDRVPCEFVQFGQCSMSFSVDEVEELIQHIADQHLNNILPAFCICWFCDSAKFEAHSRQPQDRRDCYRARMQHNAEHFRRGLTARLMRPDFHFLDHVHDRGFIDDRVFEKAKRKSEGHRSSSLAIHEEPRKDRMERSQCNIVVENSRRNRASRKPNRS